MYVHIKGEGIKKIKLKFGKIIFAFHVQLLVFYIFSSKISSADRAKIITAYLLTFKVRG